MGLLGLGNKPRWYSVSSHVWDILGKFLQGACAGGFDRQFSQEKALE
jgi:hypothetical protein